MKLKAAVLSVLGRDGLKEIVDDLEIDGVDRRSVQALRAALSRSRRVTPDVLLDYLSKDELHDVCDVMGLSVSGRKGDLVERLLDSAQPRQPKRATKRGRSMASEDAGKRGEKGCRRSSPRTRQPKTTTTYRRTECGVALVGLGCGKDIRMDHSPIF